MTVRDGGVCSVAEEKDAHLHSVSNDNKNIILSVNKYVQYYM